MDERQNRIDELFAAAVELEPSQRDRLLEDACRGDATGIRAQVEKLLAFDASLCDARRGFLTPSSLSVSAIFPHNRGSELAVGQRIGQYIIQQPLGTGGFADVFLAARDGDFQRKVALKLIHASVQARDDIMGRFLIERQVLATLSHPNIARLFDGGCTSDGRPYLIMEYVDGAPIVDYCDRNELGLENRLKLFQAVCRAVAYAHRQGVIHRDLKPDNILVDNEGAPKLVDFGIAKIVSAEMESLSASVTRTGSAPLTPEFASPEQIRGEPVSTQSDIYSLGVIL